MVIAIEEHMNNKWAVDYIRGSKAQICPGYLVRI